MPKYYPYKICGYYLYYTEHCVLEAMYVQKIVKLDSMKNN